MRRAFRLPVGRGSIAREVDDELAFHLDARVRSLIARGMTAEAAQMEARRQFGNVEAVRQGCITLDEERVRTMERVNFLDDLRHDVAYAVRTLGRNAGFTAVVVLTLALGIGANTAIFTLVNAALLRPLPVRHPEQLIALGDPAEPDATFAGTTFETEAFSYEVYRELRDRNTVATGLAAEGVAEQLDVVIGHGAAQPEHSNGRFVSANYFTVLGVPAIVGRTFGAGEDAPVGGAPVVVISDGYWTRRFSRDPHVVGRSIEIDGTPLTVVGVAERGFTGEVMDEACDLWIPLAMQPVVHPHQPLLTDHHTYWLHLTGRLRPGATLAGAEAAFRTLIRQAGEAQAKAEPQQTIMPNPFELYMESGAKGFSSTVRRSYGTSLVTLLGGVALLLLIICANIGNLLLARAIARGREMAVRLAIGAARARLVRQLLTESAILGLLGALGGLLVAAWGSRLLLTVAGIGGDAPFNLRLDLPVLAFTGVVALAVVMIFGLAPALRATRVDVARALRSQGRGSVGTQRGAGRIPMGRLLVIAQVALSLVLLIGAALLVRSLSSIEHMDTGLDRDHLLMVDVDVRSGGYAGERLETLVQELNARFAQLPGVTAATFSKMGIFSGSDGTNPVEVPGFTPRTATDSIARYDEVGPGYVRAIGGHLLAGREFTTSDGERSAPVIMVNETMARFYFGNANPIGRTVALADSLSRPFAASVVGVLADVHDHQLDGRPVRRYYVPFLQHPGESQTPLVRFEIRAAGDPNAIIPSVRRAIAAVDPALPIGSTLPLSWLMRRSIGQERLLARLASGFGTVALLLAALGLYGVMTYAINRRTGEIGLRAALGAERRDIVRMVLGDSLRIVAAGIIIGIPLGLAATRLIGSQLHGVHPTDPASLAVAIGVLTASAVMASLLPALRAARVAPVVALREE